MNTENQIPAEIAAIIKRKEQSLLEEKRQQEVAQQRATEEAQVQGQIKFNEYLQDTILKTPEWIRPYLDLQYEGGPDYLRIGKGFDHVETLSLFFSIPGLAEIEFDPKLNQWRCEVSGWNRNYGDAEPYIHFGNNSYWRGDIECVLREARRERRDYDQCLSEYAVQMEEQAKRAEAYALEQKIQEAKEAESYLRHDLKRQQEQTEEQALFDAIRHDPIVIHMLKAFVLLRDERNTFEQRLMDADETMSSIENRWSRRAEELRRQADEAQRRADDEKARIQSDLEDAEAKLVKEHRKNNGW
jgi:hypothetical protein